MAISIGAALLLFFGIGSTAFIDVDRPGEESHIAQLIVCFCFAALGAWLLYRGIRQNRLIQDCSRYAVALTSSKAVTLGNLASVLGEDSGQVRSKLDRMIRLGYLEGVYIDNSTDCIVFLENQCGDPKGKLPIRGGNKTELKRQEMVPVTCPACGGVTMVPLHEAGQCDYCGSRIQG